MSSSPLISVIIPCFNIADRFFLLKEAIRSVWRQTYPCYEIIVVDDASRDETVDLIQDFIKMKCSPKNRDKIRLKILEAHGGVSAARNCGIVQAKGEIVAFLDYDDIYLPGYLEQVAILYRQGCKDRFFLAPAFFLKIFHKWIFIETINIPQTINSWEMKDIVTFVLKNNFPTPMGSGISIPRKILLKNNIKFSEYLSFLTAEDVHFGLSLLKRGVKPFVFQDTLVVHRSYFHTTSRGLSAEIRCDCFKTYKFILRDVVVPLLRQHIASDKHCHETLTKHIRNQCLIFKIQSMILRGRYKKAFFFSCSFKHLFLLKHVLRYFLLHFSSRFFRLFIFLNFIFFIKRYAILKKKHTCVTKKKKEEIVRYLKSLNIPNTLNRST